MITLLFIAFFVSLGAFINYMFMQTSAEIDATIRRQSELHTLHLLALANARIIELDQYASGLQKVIFTIDERNKAEILQ